MKLIEQVKKSVLKVINDISPVTDRKTVGVGNGIFQMVSFVYNLESANYNGNSRLRGNFTIDFLMVPPMGYNTPTIGYDEIVSKFQATYAPVFKDAGINVLWVNYENASSNEDKTMSGVSTLLFRLNIEAIEKRQ
ncbi:hypothetical protein MLN06_002805 [Escherichia coli]|nr:hypothetical protein [Escherichia coli]MCV1685113.1 hypothetical protein [Escherichia coli]